MLKRLLHGFRLIFFMFQMVHLRILNNWSRFECWKSSSTRDKEKRIHCYVNKPGVLHLFTNTLDMDLPFFGQNDWWQTR